MAGVFGPSGREVFQQLQRERAQQAAQVGQTFAGLSPSQVSQAAFAQGGALTGQAVGQAFQQEEPFQVRQANAMQEAQRLIQASGVDANDPVAFADATADALARVGLIDQAREAGLEADKARNRAAERENAMSLVRSRLTAAQQERQDRLQRESREREGQLDRESRERIAQLRLDKAQTTSTPKEKVRRAASGTERKDARTVLQAELPDEWAALSTKERDDISSFVATRARDIAAATPGLDFAEAQLEAVREAQQGISGEARMGMSFLGGVDFERPAIAQEGGTGPAVVETRRTPDGRTLQKMSDGTVREVK